LTWIVSKTDDSQQMLSVVKQFSSGHMIFITAPFPCYGHNKNLSPLQTFVFTTAPSLPFMYPATRI